MLHPLVGSFWGRGRARSLEFAIASGVSRSTPPCARSGWVFFATAGCALISTGSFAAMSIIDSLAYGLMIADLVAVIASFDIVAPEVDR